MKNFLVTGASGFIGSWVLRQLLEGGNQVIALDLKPAHELWQRVCGKNAERIQFDSSSLICPESLHHLIESHSVDHVIHLAALLTPACQSDPWLGFQTNVVGSTALFEAAKRSGKIRSISYTSSYAVYGDEADDPAMFYGAFKQSVDLIARQYWLHENIPSVGVRPHVVYGPEREVGLTAGPSLAAKAAARNEMYEIGYSGVAGYDYVEDVASALIRSALDCPDDAAIIDMRCQTALSDDIVNAIEKIIPGSRELITVDGPGIPASVPTQPNFIDVVYPDFETTSLEEGIRKTIEYYLSD